LPARTEGEMPRGAGDIVGLVGAALTAPGGVVGLRGRIAYQFQSVDGGSS
jgi:hypothetical protein